MENKINTEQLDELKAKVHVCFTAIENKIQRKTTIQEKQFAVCQTITKLPCLENIIFWNFEDATNHELTLIKDCLIFMCFLEDANIMYSEDPYDEINKPEMFYSNEASNMDLVLYILDYNDDRIDGKISALITLANRLGFTWDDVYFKAIKSIEDINWELSMR